MFYSLPQQALRISRLIRFLIVALLLAIAIAVAVGPLTAYAATWTSSDKFGTWTSGGYTVTNDVWGSGAGSQTIWANSGSNWGVWSDQPNTGGVKSYPHSDRDIGKSLSSLNSTTSSFNVSIPGGGAYETTYDIWANSYSYEIMLWMNKTGAVGPIGSYQTNVSVGNYNWNVYKGSNGSNPVFSFLNTGSTTSGTVNVLAVLKWIESKGWYGNVTLSHVQFGFEITSTNGGQNFTDNSYSVSYN
jgi:hypothetical protein